MTHETHTRLHHDCINKVQQANNQAQHGNMETTKWDGRQQVPPNCNGIIPNIPLYWKGHRDICVVAAYQHACYHYTDAAKQNSLANKAQRATQ